MKGSLFALALGTLALGIAEFVMMGVLPYVAASLGVSIAVAGDFIAAYALGVVAGSCLMIFAGGRRPRPMLIGLALVITLGNGLAAWAPDARWLLVARFVSGLPHGAYFGVAGVVAERLAPSGRGAQAVSIMVAGMTVANLFGVPLGTYLSLNVSWRVTFALVAVIGVIVATVLRFWIPELEASPHSGLAGQFRFLKRPGPWLLLAAITLGNGGIFSWYSYITPLFTGVSGFEPESVGALMFLSGAGMVAGNLVGGRLADRFPPGGVTAVMQLVAALTLAAIFVFADIGWLSATLACLCAGCLFAVSSPEQMLLIRHSPGGQMLGAAAAQMAFNLGNAMGAALGSRVLAHHLDVQATALAGVPLALAGFVCLFVFHRLYEPRR